MPSATVARAIFHRAGSSELCRDGMGWLALRLLGPEGLEYSLEDEAPPVELLDRPSRLRVRGDLPRAQLTMAIAVGIATWWQRGHGGRLPMGVEIHELAIALVMPEVAVLDAIHVLGMNASALAHEFACPRAIVVARLRALNSQLRSGTRWRFGEAI